MVVVLGLVLVCNWIEGKIDFDVLVFVFDD